MHRPMTEGAARPVIEVGWLLDARLDGVDREAAERASDETLEVFAAEFPDLAWSMPVVDQELVQKPREEPTTLLEAGSVELSLHHWDFALVVTASDLRSHDLPSAVAVLSRALGVAVLSTFRIDPRIRRRDASRDERVRAMRSRLARHATYMIARLGGLERAAPGAPAVAGAEDEDVGQAPALELDERRRAALREELGRVADERVEEEPGSEHAGRAGFHVRAAWRNRRELLHNACTNRSWEFPVRMSRLTTAAISALAILMLTAESWEIAAQLPAATVASLVLVAVVSTSAYVVRRQRLLALHRTLRPTEQIVVTRLSGAIFVLMGVSVTWALLFAIGLAAGAALLGPELAERWTGARPIGLSGYAAQAGFASAIAVLVGSLGAALEGQRYVSHVAFVDEEV